MIPNQELSFNHQPDKTKPVYTLSVAARLSGISVFTIQQYIRKGLLLPFKTETNRNLFSEINIEHLLNIRRMIDEQGLNVAGIKALYSLVPCWLITSCDEKERIHCAAYTSNASPCWEATEKGRKCKYSDCRLCEVYRLLVESKDFKSLLKTIINN